MDITKDILEEFEEITNFDAISFIQAYVDFLQKDLSKIQLFFSGQVKNNSQDAFDNLKQLRITVEDFYSTFRSFEIQLWSFKWWDLLEEIERIEHTISLMENMSKWMRSSILNSSFSQDQLADSNLIQGETLADFSRTREGSSDPNNDWYELALLNDLTEEEYTTDGGNLLYYKKRNGPILFIESVVDNIIGETILGLDIQQTMEFADDDLVVLSHKDTFYQAVDILATLKKGDNPEFYEIGLQPGVTAGSNINSIGFPVILRQMSESFGTDDTIRTSEVTEIRRDQDALFIDFEVESMNSDTTIASVN